MQYYATYRNNYGWEKGEAPVGIFVEKRVIAPDWDSMEYHAIAWDHLQHAWVYDPDEIAAYLSEEGTEFRQRTLERVTPLITGGEELPDEDTILWIFQWKGNPPQAEDTPHRWAWNQDRE